MTEGGKLKIAINGFGRIGRVALRVMHARGLHTSLAAVNDLTDAPTLAHLLKYDSNYGQLKAEIASQLFDNRPPYSGMITLDGVGIYVLSVKEPSELPWRNLGVELVIEATGRFASGDGMAKHIAAGAKKVILTAPVDGEGVPTVVRGVNDPMLTPATSLVSNASCTTNCITPVAAVIETAFGIEKAMMTTIHSYTADQVLQDGPHKDLRRARAAAQNIVPTTTGATKAASQALPSLRDTFGGLSIRVPTPVGSLSDFTFLVKKSVNRDDVNAALQQASQTTLKGLMDYSEAPLVSSDIVGSPASCVIDSQLTQVVGGNLVKVIAWYDNEWGYCQRLIDQVEAMMK